MSTAFIVLPFTNFSHDIYCVKRSAESTVVTNFQTHIEKLEALAFFIAFWEEQ